jgi:transposase-like protein
MNRRHASNLRRLVYTTHTIESLNFQLRKVLKTKGHFPSEEAALKLLFLALRNIEKKWQAPPAFWMQAFVQLVFTSARIEC